MSSNRYSNLLKIIQEKEIRFIDYRFTDFNGKWHHITHTTSNLSESLLNDGIRFDGSSIHGWKTIEDSDMILDPVIETAFVDPFMIYPTLVINCNVIDPSTSLGYNKDPRNTALKAEQYLQNLGIADTAYFGPELEFFIFDDVRFKISNNENSYYVNSDELSTNSSKEYETGNLGHRPQEKGGYMPVPPIDSGQDIRLEIVNTLQEVGINASIAHHEVACAQHEIGFEYSTLTDTADSVQKYKYALHNTVTSFGKTATFMPKPIYNDNGSGMHVHQSLWKNNKNLFAGSSSANCGLSQTALYYIGGILKHLNALNAFTNASTNSYKRLIPGFEAPIVGAYSARNRSGAIRIPYTSSEKALRIEARFPDCTANPYLSFSALLLAGIDGIKNKIDPGQEDATNLYTLSRKELKSRKLVSASLDHALDSLEQDHQFLLEGGVFKEDQIESYIDIKRQEALELSSIPHPVEFKNSYSC